jgi:hypothetical protein
MTNRLTGGGLSPGLDEALKPITLLFDEADRRGGAGGNAILS